MLEQNRSAFLESVAWASPTVLTFLIGMAVATFFVFRLGMPAIMALLGCGLMCLARIVNLGSFYYQLTLHSRADIAGSEAYFKLVNACTTLLHLLGFTLVFAAIFVGRKNPNAVGER